MMLDWLGDKQYVTGDDISLGDVAMHGALTCVKEFPIFTEVVGKHHNVAQWYERVAQKRAENRAN